MRKMRLGMKSQLGRDRLDRWLGYAEAAAGVRDATAVEITARCTLELSIKKPGEMRDRDTGLVREAIPIQRQVERP